MMSQYVAKLRKPYNSLRLIEAYSNSKRPLRPEIAKYYASLVSALEPHFGIRMDRDALTFNHKILWCLFESTIQSIHQICNPWASFVEATLLERKLKETGETGRKVTKASAAIRNANEKSGAAHWDILEALFLEIFGQLPQIVTSEQLLASGFDDSREPDWTDYM